MNLSAIPVLPVRLHWSNLIAFQRYLMDYTASRSTAVGTSLTGGFDFEPPPDFSPTQQMLRSRTLRELNVLTINIEKIEFLSVPLCHQSLSNDIQNRVNQELSQE